MLEGGIFRRLCCTRPTQGSRRPRSELRHVNTLLAGVYGRNYVTFINNIPASAATLVPACKGFDMVVHHLDELGLAEVTVCHPIWELAVPDQVVAVDLDAVGGGVVNVSVCVCELPNALAFPSGQQIMRIQLLTVKFPRSGSVDSHICAFSGVIELKSALLP